LISLQIIDLSTNLNASHTYFDIKSGRYKRVDHFLGIKIREVIEETGFSRLYGKYFELPSESDWQIVSSSTFFNRRFSPHYKYHHALFGAQLIVNAIEIGNFTQEAEKQILKNYLYLLQRDGNDFNAKEYAQSVIGLAHNKFLENTRKIDVEELPPLPGSTH